MKYKEQNVCEKAKLLSSNSNYYNAINLLGKCLTLLYKNETDDKLLETYVNIGEILIRLVYIMLPKIIILLQLH